MYDKYLDYITNTGDKCLVIWFDEDWEPIGPRLRADMFEAGLVVEESDGDRPYLRRL